MKRYILFLPLLGLAACGRTFEQRTAKYDRVRELCDDRAAVLETEKEVSRWGYVDPTGELVIPCSYSEADDFSEGRAAVRGGGGLYGYIATDGRTVVPMRYTRATPFEDGLAWVQEEDAYWGRIDRQGREVIPCLYNRIGQPQPNGWRPVERDGKSGMIGADGGVVVPCRYDRIGEPNVYGLLPVVEAGKRGFLDTLGREVLPCSFACISEFREGYARINYGGTPVPDAEPYGGLWGLIDSLGRETIPCRYSYLAAPGEGLAAFSLEEFGNYGYVDVKGNVAVTPRFTVARPYSNGAAVVSYNNVNFGLIDRNGNEISSFRYKRIGEFGDGLAPFDINPYGMNFQGMEPRCGYVDTEGREVIPARYDDAGVFCERRAAVMRFGTNPEDFYDARWGYITPVGELIVPFRYHEAHPFRCGRARVFVKGAGYGYIDRKGNEIVPCKYLQAEDFVDFTARVRLNDRVFTIDDKGNVLDDSEL